MEKIVKIINALLAKARDASVTEAEATAFIEKAHELLSKHNLEMQDLEIKGMSDVNVVAHRVDKAHWQWEVLLHTYVGKLYFCKVFRHRFVNQYKSGKRYVELGYTYVGRQHNVDIALSMSHYLIATVRRLASKHDGNRLDFAKGCANRLAWRLDELATAKRTPAPSNTPALTGGNTLPALYNAEDARNAAKLEEMKISLGEPKQHRPPKEYVSYRAGVIAGDDIGLDPQVGGAAAHPAIGGR